MTERKYMHITPNPGSDKKWKIQEAGEETPISTHDTQREAIDEARRIGIEHGKSEVFVHRPDGRIRDRSTYGDDPRDTKG